MPNLLKQLNGSISFRVLDLPESLRERLAAIPGATVLDRGPQALELECPDVKDALVRLVATLKDLKLELVNLETEEPNLERVFLHLTGRALRD